MSEPGDTVKVQHDLFKSIARAVDNLKKKGLNNATKGSVKSRLDQLEKNWNKFESNHISLCPFLEKELKADPYVTEDVFASCEEKYLCAKGEFMDLLDKFALDETSHSNESSEGQVNFQNRATIARTLPKITLPKFSGQYREWVGFRDLFMSMVGNNDSLTQVEKLHYLKTNVHGAAAGLIANIPVTENNFERSWQKLQSRYDNKRALVTAQMDVLFALKPIQRKGARELESLRSTVADVLEALQALGGPVDQWDMFLVYFICRRLDDDTHEQWEIHLGNSTNPPKYTDLDAFLEGRIRALENVDTRGSSFSRSRPSATSTPRMSRVLTATTSAGTCSCCREQHFIASCPVYRGKSPEERRALLADKNLCFNCLSASHRVRDCRVTKRCNVCSQPHHTTIHPRNASTPGASSQETSTGAPANTRSHRTGTSDSGSTNLPQTSASVNHSSAPVSTVSSVLLPTALIQVTSPQGRSFEARALLDQGSEISLISETLAQSLRLKRSHSTVALFGIGAMKCSSTRGSVSLCFRGLNTPCSEFRVNAHIVPKVTGKVPSQFVHVQSWTHLAELQLADPLYMEPRSVDVLLGADVYGQLLLEDIRRGKSDSPVAQLTELGWVISGSTCSAGATTPAPTILSCSCDHQLLDLVRDFWKQEVVSPPSSGVRSEEDVQCENFFADTHSRTGEGRYVVRLPFKTIPTNFADSRLIATRMLRNMHRRFLTNPTLSRYYVDFLTEYQTLKHMEPVKEVQNECAFYLPHHGVLRESSSTTKLRVVFNGSQKTRDGFSLNDCLLPGPKVQTDIIDILLRWRQHAFVFSADIEKMYRQVLIHPDDRRFQRVLWSKDPSESITCYQLNTVTYGLTSAPYLALRVLSQLAADEGKNYPLAVDVIESNMYVDDVLAGGESIEAARAKAQDTSKLLTAGGFHLHKWAANDESILDGLPSNQHLRGPKNFEEGKEEQLLRALGLCWNSSSDSFVITFQKDIFSSGSITKRTILSSIAKLFDPLGWVAPVLITAKILLQSLWKIELGWDDPLPISLAESWKIFSDGLRDADWFSVPRWMGTEPFSTLEIHGFSDASQCALAAVVYLRVINEDFHAHTSLVLAKTKVAPVKPVTIPRLELCAAVLLSQLVSRVKAALRLSNIPTHLWLDSSVALAWVKAQPTQWRDYVCNRVARIQELVPQAVWHHVPGQHNPADVASRGIHPTKLRDFSLWWHGPSWLALPSTSWPSSPLEPSREVLLEVRPQTASAHATTADVSIWELIDKYSSLYKLLRVTARIFQAIDLMRGKHTGSQIEPSYVLSPHYIDKARQFWIKTTQEHYFSEDLKVLRRKVLLPRSSCLLPLCPFVDGEGVLRLGGRLDLSSLDYSNKHPVILPRKSTLTTLVIADTHKKTLHGGVQLTLSTIRQQFWIIGGRSPIRTFILRCVTCARQRGQTARQLMGQLPRLRTEPARTFLRTGVDYAGPFTVKTWRGRNAKTYKAYIVLFVCLVTSAVHLELSSDYSTSGFLAAYRRFVGRRGTCETLVSDCGTNFTGADAELKRMFTASSKDFEELRNLIANDGVRWVFNPPGAPHFGGKWEAAVKSAKFHLKRVVGDNLLTFEEFYSLLCQIEGILNSRPLCPLSDDPSDLNPLTPGHFLVGGPLNSIPEPSLRDVTDSHLSRWQRVSKLRDQFWTRWSKEYLQRLQGMSKWHSPSYDLRVGTLVLLADERYPPSKWPLARVTALHPGADGLVRVVSVRTATGSIFRRPIVKICILPV